MKVGKKVQEEKKGKKKGSDEKLPTFREFSVKKSERQITEKAEKGKEHVWERSTRQETARYHTQTTGLKQKGDK